MDTNDNVDARCLEVIRHWLAWHNAAADCRYDVEDVAVSASDIPALLRATVGQDDIAGTVKRFCEEHYLD